jgi:ketosteroid isomerase-like protein
VKAVRTSRRRLTASLAPVLLFVSILPAIAAPPPESESLVESVRAAETAFAAAARARDREAFASFIAEDAIFLDAVAHNGRPAILEAWAPFFAEGGPKVEWAPELVEVQQGGALGVTRGSFSVTHRGSGGETVVSSGTFNSIWRREPDGSWKIIFDIGCPPCADP